MNEPKVTVPRKLTAENGAKEALMGEFSMKIPLFCGCGGEDGCVTCGGAGEYKQPVNVPWVTIKKIYEAAILHFEGEQKGNR